MKHVLLSIAIAISSAWLAGVAALFLRRVRNDVLSRHGVPPYHDIAMPRDVIIVLAVLGAVAGALGPLAATAPALLFVVLTAIVTLRQSRQR